MTPFHVLLLNPEIAGNTGNIIRLCANTGAALHLIKPLGFELDDARMRRAGLDYREFAAMRTHDSLDACLAALAQPRLFAFSARATTQFQEPAYRPGDAFLFGPESTGLSSGAREHPGIHQLLRIPMLPSSRSLNLSNAVAVTVYEGLRQLGYPLG